MIWLHAQDAKVTASGVRDARSRFPQSAVVVLSNIPSDAEAVAALAVGAHGYCNAHADPRVLKEVAEVVTHGGLWVGESLLSRLLVELAQRLGTGSADRMEGVFSQLTEREREIARRAATGKTNKEIARDLNIAERTVKAHLTVVFGKLGVRDRLQLVLLCNQRTTA